MFYKIVSLHKLGVKIHLHCFTGDRQPQDELDQYCETVQYYQRKKFPQGFSPSLPYIVASRRSEELLRNLQQDDYPILMDGIHCTHLLQTGKLSARKVFVRLHNVEFSYYKKLASHERNMFKKLYFLAESFLLKKYEKKIAGKATFWPISLKDVDVYKDLFGAKNIELLPAFVPWVEVSNLQGKGCFCLYHGNLEVNENEKAASWLLTEVFNNIKIPLVIAGHNPSDQLEKLAHVHKNTCLVSNPSDKEMQDLIQKAQVHVLPSFNDTGVKLKLLNALYNGRHCLVNLPATEGVALDGLCEVAATANEFKEAAAALYEKPYTSDDATHRQNILSANYNNEANARKLIQWIY